MCIKTCPNCGWQYPSNYTRAICTICGYKFSEQKCSKCGKVKPVEEFAADRPICKDCMRNYKRNQWHVFSDKLKAEFNEWLEKIKAVPKDYPTLTEEQWIEACRYFGGCARCGSKDIDTRGFFVHAKLGGRYCDWNILPLCEKCANHWDTERSAFIYIYKHRHRHGKPEYLECLEKIKTYLGGKLDNAVKKVE